MPRPNATLQSSGPAATDTRGAIMDLVQGFTAAQALMTANEVGLLDLLAAGELSVKRLPRRLGCSARGIRALLDALAGLGLLERRDDRVSLVPGARGLFLPTGPDYLGDVLRHQRRLYERWGRLEHAVRTGRPAKTSRGGTTNRKQFLQAMVGGSRRSVGEVFTLVDLSECRTFLDLGGGLGAYAIAARERWPRLECTLFDIPDAIRLARRFLKERGLQSVIACIPGDARTDDLGGPYDAILISNVLHMFSPSECIAILRRAGRALSPSGRVMVKDFVLRDNRAGPRRAALFGLNMLVNTEGGGVFSDGEFCGLFARAGLERRARHDIGEGSRIHFLQMRPPRS